MTADWGEGTSDVVDEEKGKERPATLNDATWLFSSFPSIFGPTGWRLCRHGQRNDDGRRRWCIL